MNPTNNLKLVVTLAAACAIGCSINLAEEIAIERSLEAARDLMEAADHLMDHDKKTLLFSDLVVALKKVGLTSSSGQGLSRSGRSRSGRGAQGAPMVRFVGFDRDQNGLLEGDEISDYLRNNTEYAEDNVVTKDEYLSAWERLLANRTSRPGHIRGGHAHMGSSERGSNRASDVTDIQFLTTIDSSKDHMIVASEVARAISDEIAQVAQSRTSLDSDQDGIITLAEYRLSRPGANPADTGEVNGHTRRHFEMEDTNDDGVIDSQEVFERATRGPLKRVQSMAVAISMAKADSNADGKLIQKELGRAIDGMEFFEQFKRVVPLSEEPTAEYIRVRDLLGIVRQLPPEVLVQFLNR